LWSATTPGKGSSQLALDRQLAKTYFDSMIALQKELGATGEISIETVLRAPGVLRIPEEQIAAEDAWPHVESSLKGRPAGTREDERTRGETPGQGSH
jgi:uncharacterized protein YicC (UPF0701 family)